MFANCQISNQNSSKSQSNTSQAFHWGCDHRKEENRVVISSSFSHDLIEELTIKNKLLAAQLSQYRILVANLTQKLSQRQQRVTELAVPIETCEEKEPAKLRTIQQEFSTMSEITNHSGRRQIDAESEYYLHSFSALLRSYSIETKNESWESKLSAVTVALGERRDALLFIERVQQMKQMLEPGDSTIQELWQWLKKVGANYHCLLSYEQTKMQRKLTRK